jgi:hypothetical protein
MTTSVSVVPEWEQRLIACLPLYGHRNWIVVADSAYPAQSKPGIETILATCSQAEAVAIVSRAIGACTHIKANVYTDEELELVPESDAPGITEYRKRLTDLFHGARVNCLPHEQIIAKLDHAAQLFRILIIKTNMTIPYTSVFFELDCAYWNADAEARLRAAMPAAK